MSLTLMPPHDGAQPMPCSGSISGSKVRLSVSVETQRPGEARRGHDPVSLEQTPESRTENSNTGDSTLSL